MGRFEINSRKPCLVYHYIPPTGASLFNADPGGLVIRPLEQETAF